MLDNEEGSIEQQANNAWGRYNPDWLLAKIGNGTLTVTEMREIFVAGYKAAIYTKLTGEVPTHEEL